jgi:hypothetical protein
VKATARGDGRVGVGDCQAANCNGGRREGSRGGGNDRRVGAGDGKKQGVLSRDEGTWAGGCGSACARRREASIFGGI